MIFQVEKSRSEKIARLDQERAHRVKEDTETKRLTTVPGIGPVTATALLALAPTAEAFKKGRDFAAWLVLTPLQRSTGGKQKLGETSRMGERTLRRLLTIGASVAVRWARRKGSSNPWLMNMLNRKPPMLAIVALANKMAH
ncbi:IS110 family transposase [Bradyrhizobium sp. CW4]|nr:IS110 family transposase [Bradyrhizobium sp. CW4]